MNDPKWEERQVDALQDDEWTAYTVQQPNGAVDTLWMWWEPAKLDVYTSNALKQNTVIRLDTETQTIEVFVMDPYQMDSPHEVSEIL